MFALWRRSCFQITRLKATLMIQKLDSEDIRGISSYQAR